MKYFQQEPIKIPFQCPVCNIIYKFNGGLFIHYQKKHPELTNPTRNVQCGRSRKILLAEKEELFEIFGIQNVRKERNSDEYKTWFSEASNMIRRDSLSEQQIQDAQRENYKLTRIYGYISDKKHADFITSHYLSAYIEFHFDVKPTTTQILLQQPIYAQLIKLISKYSKTNATPPSYIQLTNQSSKPNSNTHINNNSQDQSSSHSSEKDISVSQQESFNQEEEEELNYEQIQSKQQIQDIIQLPAQSYQDEYQDNSSTNYNSSNMNQKSQEQFPFQLENEPENQFNEDQIFNQCFEYNNLQFLLNDKENNQEQQFNQNQEFQFEQLSRQQQLPYIFFRSPDFQFVNDYNNQTQLGLI